MVGILSNPSICSFVTFVFFLKVRNISLGYNLPNKLTEKLGLSTFRFYAQATNPGMLFSKVDWIDLDVTRPANNDNGYSLGNSAVNRGFTLGMNLGF